ncbi:hypothetical protein FG386_001499 [Cryptosporidium ryanae]|uniref:uncharacterized protein n=1 Tax=Cryptosporidium ryanae TaxID=515981 RepID=UPI00351A00CA|nr:hypothetical protein FG386_001499 [Cryptosporidium ryanae]
MGFKTNRGKHVRCEFTDWLRSVACILVLSVHCMVAVQRILKLNDIEKEISDNYLMILLHHGMPVFFYASGRASYYSTENYNSSESIFGYIYKKIIRLIVPTVIGYFTVVAGAAYIGSEWRPCAPKGPFNSIFDFYLRFFSEFKCSGFEWLWTLPMVFILTIVNRPVTLLLRNICENNISGKKGINKNNIILSILFLSGLLFSFHILFSFPFKYVLLPIFLCYIFMIIAVKFLSKKLHSINNSFITSFFVYIPLYITSCYIGLKLDYIVDIIINNSGHNSYSCILANGMKLVDDEQPLRLLLAMVFYNIYYLAGFLDSLLDVDNENTRNYILNNTIPIKIIFLISINALSFPSNKSLVSYIWAYPYYSGGITTFIFVIGTWVWLELFRISCVYLFNNTEISKKIQNHLSQSGIVIYITHAVWLEFVIKYILVYFLSPLSPFSLYDGKSISVFGHVFTGFGMLSSWVFLMINTLILSLLTYVFIIKSKIISFFFGISLTGSNESAKKNR